MEWAVFVLCVVAGIVVGARSASEDFSFFADALSPTISASMFMNRRLGVVTAGMLAVAEVFQDRDPAHEQHARD
jgi:hypothetical protein